MNLLLLYFVQDRLLLLSSFMISLLVYNVDMDQ